MTFNTPELFLDDGIIERTYRLGRTVHPLAKWKGGPLIRPDRPWEAPMLAAYGTAMEDPESGLLRFWYISCARRPDRRRTLVCYAESEDGLNWHKPELATTWCSTPRRTAWTASTSSATAGRSAKTAATRCSTTSRARRPLTTSPTPPTDCAGMCGPNR